MGEIGIIMSGNHPKLILDGIKTMTRRVLKPQPDLGIDPYDSYSHIEVGHYHPVLVDKNGEMYPSDEIFGAYTDDGEWGWKFPYGGVGDRLWVRETALYWVSPILEGVEYDKPSDWWSDCVYQDDPEITQLLTDNKTLRATREIEEAIEGESVFGKWEWKPSIHMPRHYSRITLEVTEVRVERLNQITEEDARAEGIHITKGTWQSIDIKNHKLIGEPQPYTARYHFEALWDSLNAKRGYDWNMNPWVWVISFKVVKDAGL